MLLPTVLITVPRHALSYPLYGLSCALLIDYRATNKRPYFILSGIIIWLSATYLVLLSQRSLSPTAFFLELVLILPLLAFLSGFTFTRSNALTSIRLINLICLIYGMISLVEHGFPLKLPYRDFLSDAYWGPYGWGGARIVTIFGFTGVLLEISAASLGKQHRIWLLLAFANFIAPSYIMGMVCGLAALLLVARKRPWPILTLCILLIPAGLFALGRLEHVNPSIAGPATWHPKILAYMLVLDLFSQETLNLVTGTGLGQFTSTPQLWASEALRAKSYQPIPSLPGLFNSELHLAYVEPVIDSIKQASFRMGSALSKPFAGFATLLSEVGLLFLLFAYLFLKRSREICTRNIMALPFFVFFVSLNMVDMWIDNLWLGYCLMLTTGFFATPKGNKHCS